MGSWIGHTTRRWKTLWDTTRNHRIARYCTIHFIRVVSLKSLNASDWLLKITFKVLNETTWKKLKLKRLKNLTELNFFNQSFVGRTNFTLNYSYSTRRNLLANWLRELKKAENKNFKLEPTNRSKKSVECMKSVWKLYKDL